MNDYILRWFGMLRGENTIKHNGNNISDSMGVLG